MTLTPEQITAAALAMSAEGRQDLLVQLMDSLEDPPDDDYEEAWAEEIKRRLDDYRSGRSIPIPAAEAHKLIFGDHDDDAG
ncbi:MAG: addiction module protein [Gemmataceae bacterium]|nr:addiction module protein [Gemmataceae bacterium]